MSTVPEIPEPPSGSAWMAIPRSVWRDLPRRLDLCEWVSLTLILDVCTAAPGDEILSLVERAGDPPGEALIGPQFFQSRAHIPAAVFSQITGFGMRKIQTSLKRLVELELIGCEDGPKPRYWPRPENWATQQLKQLPAKKAGAL